MVKARDANSLAIFIPRRFEELGVWHFFIPQGSGNLEPIPWGPRGIFGNWIPLNEQSLIINMTHNEDKA